jgi:hypothetical protein
MNPHGKRLQARSAPVLTALVAGLASATAFAQDDKPTVAQAGAQPPSGPAGTVSGNEAPPPSLEDESAKPLSASVWGRIGNVIQGSDTTRLDDFAQDAEVDLMLSGQIHPIIGWQADFIGILGSGDQNGTASVLDLIGKLDLHENFNVWVGRMLVPSDRAIFSGPWFQAPWNYPGLYPGLSAPVGPRAGLYGRSDGITAWGQFNGGVFKYYLGAFDLRQRAESPLYTARINVSLINPEPGYYNSSTYYGMDILAIGVGAQHKRSGSVASPVPAPGIMPAPGNYNGFNVDLLYEKNLGGTGVVDFEAAYYVFDGVNEPLDNHFYLLGSYLFPDEVGVGRLQPLFRLQGASPRTGGDTWQLWDAQVGYIISKDAARLALGYQYAKIGPTASNSVFVGLQLQK